MKRVVGTLMGAGLTVAVFGGAALAADAPALDQTGTSRSR